MADRLSSATRRASEACRHGAITEDGRLPINSTALSRSPASRSITRPLIVRSMQSGMREGIAAPTAGQSSGREGSTASARRSCVESRSEVRIFFRWFMNPNAATTTSQTELATISQSRVNKEMTSNTRPSNPSTSQKIRMGRRYAKRKGERRA